MLPGKKYDVSTILTMVKRRGWLLVLPPVVGLFIALVVSARLPNLYQSDMLIAIVPQRVPDNYVRSTVTLRTEERLDAISTQVTSRTLIERLIQEYDLFPGERQRLPLEDVVDLMRRSIEVQPEAPRRGPRGVEPIHAFHVRFTYTDPAVAAKVTQRLGSLFVDQNARDRGALAEATNEFLEGQLGEARERLVAIENRLKAFREEHGSELPTQMQSNMQAIQTTQMQIQALVEAIARGRDRKLMLERLYNDAVNEPAVPPTPPPQQAQGNATSLSGTPEQQLVVLRSTLAKMETRLQPGHPDIVTTKRLIADLEARVAETTPAPGTTAQTAPALTQQEQQRRDRLRSMKAEIDSLDRLTQWQESEEKRLRGLVAEYQRRIEAVPGVESQWLALSRDYDTQQAAYKELLTKSELSKLAVDLERQQIGEQFKVLDPAGVPVRPISPNRIQINAIGFAVGLFIGIGIAALLEIRDKSFLTEADVMDALSLPVLALVPHVVTDEERLGRRRKLAVGALSGVVTVGLAAYAVWSLRLWNFLV